MASDKIRHFKLIPNKNGTFRAYWEPSKSLRDLGWASQPLGKGLSAMQVPQAKARAMAINDQVDQWRLGQAVGMEGVRPAPLSNARLRVSTVMDQWQQSDDFKSKPQNTRKFYLLHIEFVKTLWGDIFADELTASHVFAGWEPIAKETPRKAQAIVQTGQAGFKWGILHAGQLGAGLPAAVELSPFNKLSVRAKPKKGKLWSREAVDCFVNAAERYQSKSGVTFHSVATAVVINEWLAQNPIDIIGLRRSDYSANGFEVARQKTGIGVQVPVPDHVHARVADELARQRQRGIAGLTLLVSEQTGLPWKQRDFNAKFAAIRAEATKQMPEMKDLTFRHLRHTGITRMLQANIETSLVAAAACVSLKSVEQIIDTYGIRTNRMAREAVKMRVEYERRED